MCLFKVLHRLLFFTKKKEKKRLGQRHEGDVNNSPLRLLGDSLGVSEGKEVT